jgi:hypothetical protein
MQTFRNASRKHIGIIILQNEEAIIAQTDGVKVVINGKVIRNTLTMDFLIIKVVALSGQSHHPVTAIQLSSISQPMISNLLMNYLNS